MLDEYPAETLLGEITPSALIGEWRRVEYDPDDYRALYPDPEEAIMRKARLYPRKMGHFARAAFGVPEELDSEDWLTRSELDEWHENDDFIALAAIGADRIATRIREMDYWDEELVDELVRLAGLSQICDRKGLFDEDAESVVFKAADRLNVAIM